MRRFVIACSCLSMIVVSCNKSRLDSNPISSVLPVRSNQVSLSDVRNYLVAEKGIIGTKTNSVSIEPILNGMDTVMYLVNYENGWEVLSGDRRASKVLIKADSGSITKEDLLSNPTISLYTNRLSRGLSSIMHDSNYDVPSEVKDSWKKTYRGPGLDINTRLIRILASVDTLYAFDYCQDHLMQTKWGQGYPWNQEAPYMDSTRTVHCYTGCVPVAAAQVLYYLHNKLGVPQSIYGSAVTDAYIHAPYNYLILSSNDVSFYDYGNQHWTNMPMTYNTTTGSDKVSALMVYLGYLYGAKYKQTGTSAWSTSAINVFPQYFSVSCDEYDITYHGYDCFVSMLQSHIITDQLPVIMDIWDDNDNGHAIVVDGYKHYKRYISYNYEYYIIPEFGFILPGQTPDSYETVTVTEEARFVAINWGWNGSYNNTLSGDTIWYNCYANWVVSTYEFNERPYAIVNFAPVTQ